MVKLEKGTPPVYLDKQKTKELTEKFKADRSAVWLEGSIRGALLKESHNKCVYCECSVNRAGSGIEVDHFLPKSKFPDLVVDWNNLLASCKRCNTKKSFKTNSITKDIINPFEDDPKDHLSYHESNFRFGWKTELGQKTIDQLDLNSQKLLVFHRFEVSDQVHESLKQVVIFENNTAKLRNIVSDVLLLCQPETEFSVMTAHALHQSSAYKQAKIKLEELGEWDPEMQLLHDKSISILLD